MALEQQALEGLAIAALVLAIIGWGMFGFLWMMIGILEEKVSRTIDEHGVVRKQYLPGEVFAVPAMNKPAPSSGPAEARFKEMEEKLFLSAAEIKAMQQEMRDMEDKLVAAERRIAVQSQAAAAAKSEARAPTKDMAMSQPVPNGVEAVPPHPRRRGGDNDQGNNNTGFGVEQAPASRPPRQSPNEVATPELVPGPVTFVR
eukprot:CAMPEP_0173403988 /NCGR_PEP_ID=MMETSP1356-20130122/58173_1 /TAXON_ID=77927 ORGANISM="Hemiselmis virescens, Strain PCC157" /NCGR_SAMPLE_ID=MMETSP1356 /ASSEMBLY_ACC=CAM_ASM_000847 /LENGTH=200 /DNA_ID=CAMNT_0014364591 /DNA_START=110 /DNA_END=709 /DNA_ORIENTATION=+